MISSQKKRIFLVFIILSFYSGSAYSASYYVANTGCNNSYPGSEAQPWCSIPTSIGKLSPGDTLYVKGGTYQDHNIYLTGKSGTESQPITVKAYPGQTPIIRGSGYTGNRNRFTNCNYFIFDGFTITNMNQGVFIEGSNNFILRNNKVYDIGQEAVRVYVNSSYVTIDNNIIYDTGKYIYNGEGVYIGTADDASPDDNSHHITVKNNLIYNTKDEGIELKSGTHDCIIDNNVIYDGLQDSAYDTQYGVGIIEVNPAVGTHPQHWESNPNHIVRNNTIYGTKAINKTAINLSTGSTAYNNVIYGMTGSFRGISIGGDTYPRKVYHNTVDLPSSRAIVPVGSPVADIRNNIGPATSGNLATSDAYYVNKAGRDYHLVSGSAPIDAGVDLTGTVPIDRDGKNRPIGMAPDLGAYEYLSGTSAKIPNPPSNLQVY